MLRGPSTGDQTSSWHPAISSFAQTSLVVLLAVDAVFVALHLSRRLNLPAFLDVQYELTREGSYAESFQYAKELCIGLMLAALACRHRSATYGVWALVFGFLLLDDSLMV